MAVTIARLAEEIVKFLNGGFIQTATNVSLNEAKIAIGQVCNQLLKVEHLTVNMKLGEMIPNGSMLGWYENISVSSSNGKSKCQLPIKPIKLPRNMGVFGIYPKFYTNSNYELDKEFIPLQMGQGGLLQSQLMINDLLGQVGYEVRGGEVWFTKDLLALYPEIKIGMQLAILDISQYGDYDILPILPEMEMQIKQEVIKLYSLEQSADYLVDVTSKQQQGIPVTQQKQS